MCIVLNREDTPCQTFYNISAVNVLKGLFIYLVERKRDRKEEKFHSLIHLPSSHKSQGWSKPKAVFWSSVRVSIASFIQEAENVVMGPFPVPLVHFSRDLKLQLQPVVQSGILGLLITASLSAPCWPK